MASFDGTIEQKLINNITKATEEVTKTKANMDKLAGKRDATVAQKFDANKNYHRSQIRRTQAEKDLSDFRAAMVRKANRQMHRKSLRLRLKNTLKGLWSTLWRRYKGQIASRRNITRETAQAEMAAGGKFRRFRAARTYAAGWAGIVLAAPVLLVTTGLEGVFNTLGALGDWALSHISGLAGRVWGSTFRIAARTVCFVIELALVLVELLILGAFTILMGVLMLVSLPIIGLASIPGRKEKAAGDQVPLSAATGNTGTTGPEQERPHIVVPHMPEHARS